MELVHLDGDCHNDRADNLLWMKPGTKREYDAFRHCPLAETRQCLIRRMDAVTMPPPPPRPPTEQWRRLTSHPNKRNECPAVSSFGQYRAAGKNLPTLWAPKQVRSVSINGRKLMLAQIVAQAFVPKMEPLADHVMHLDGDVDNCRADNLAWYLHPKQDPGRAKSEVYKHVPPEAAAQGAAYYRRKVGRQDPESPLSDRMRYLTWAAQRCGEIERAALQPLAPSVVQNHGLTQLVKH